MNTTNTCQHLCGRPLSTADTSPHFSPPRQQGIALVVVLWLMVLLTVIAASHARVVRTETRLASNQVDAGKARSMAEAGAHHAILELLVRDEAQRWPVNGSVNYIRYQDGDVAIAIRDASGLVDINRASASLLDTVLTGAGMEQSQRLALVDAILDWRDKDDLKQINGAEDDDYRRAGMKWAARDGAFSSVEEFRYVLGMTNELFERLAPYLTVHSNQADVKVEFAPPWLISVLGDTQDSSTTRSPTRRRPNTASTYHVTVLATSEGGSNASLEMVVRIAPTKDQPYTILSWRAPARSFSPAAGRAAE